MKQLTVTVAGLTGTGKTTIAREVARHLQSLGFNVEVEAEPDGDDLPELQERRLPYMILNKRNYAIKVQSSHVRVRPPVLEDLTRR